MKEIHPRKIKASVRTHSNFSLSEISKGKSCSAKWKKYILGNYLWLQFGKLRPVSGPIQTFHSRKFPRVNVAQPIGEIHARKTKASVRTHSNFSLSEISKGKSCSAKWKKYILGNYLWLQFEKTKASVRTHSNFSLSEIPKGKSCSAK